MLFLIIAVFNDESWAFREFDFSNNLIPLKEIKSGGVSKDGIPAVIFPEMIAITNALLNKTNNHSLYQNEKSLCVAR